jgi:hypothetical protein
MVVLCGAVTEISHAYDPVFQKNPFLKMSLQKLGTLPKLPMTDGLHITATAVTLRKRERDASFMAIDDILIS